MSKFTYLNNHALLRLFVLHMHYRVIKQFRKFHLKIQVLGHTNINSIDSQQNQPSNSIDIFIN